MVAAFDPWLPPGGAVLDVGTGTGHVAERIRAIGSTVVGCDVVDLRMCGIPFVLCDGGALPFCEGSFDAVLLITVLHHVPAARHGALLAEALRVLRVGGRLVVFEDTYHGRIEKAATKWQDSVMNLEIAGHPHSNRTLTSWKRLLGAFGQVIRHEREYIAWYGVFRIRHGVLVVERVV
jgi:ubiquinone/menaquinone biosynthesis C-methylase UbiE